MKKTWCSKVSSRTRLISVRLKPRAKARFTGSSQSLATLSPFCLDYRPARGDGPSPPGSRCHVGVDGRGGSPAPHHAIGRQVSSPRWRIRPWSIRRSVVGDVARHHDARAGLGHLSSAGRVRATQTTAPLTIWASPRANQASGDSNPGKHLLEASPSISSLVGSYQNSVEKRPLCQIVPAPRPGMSGQPPGRVTRNPRAAALLAPAPETFRGSIAHEARDRLRAQYARPARNLPAVAKQLKKRAQIVRGRIQPAFR